LALRRRRLTVGGALAVAAAVLVAVLVAVPDHRSTPARPADVAAAEAASTTTVVGAPVDEPPCAGADLEIQSVQPVPNRYSVNGSALFIRAFNVSKRACAIAGVPGIELRRDGKWIRFGPIPDNQPATNGPPWTGSFDPSLVGVLLVSGPTGAPGDAVTYDALRIVLPNGDKVEHAGIEFRIAGDAILMTPWGADSQDN
jgi:hypothetical protein